mmetsp:Transcript_61695/g.101941  ORF Transcript_61695/g.101941 Transcript_61695/m.101941 type:complete len:81 (+) Transcript_61695:47-289(+)
MPSTLRSRSVFFGTALPSDAQKGCKWPLHADAHQVGTTLPPGTAAEHCFDTDVIIPTFPSFGDVLASLWSPSCFTVLFDI